MRVIIASREICRMWDDAHSRIKSVGIAELLRGVARHILRCMIDSLVQFNFIGYHNGGSVVDLEASTRTVLPLLRRALRVVVEGYIDYLNSLDLKVPRKLSNRRLDVLLAD